MKFQVGQRVDFKKARSPKWRAGRVISVDRETRRYSVMDGDNLPTVELMQFRLRAAIIYKVGDLVNASYKQSTKYFPGVISAVNTNFTYNIRFDDNDVDENVTVDKIETRSEIENLNSMQVDDGEVEENVAIVTIETPDTC
jgi:hypothetical protein